ncbi:MAG: putative baseplate assembly protein [Lysobacterales bacterium]|jgi:hypothetical protein
MKRQYRSDNPRRLQLLRDLTPPTLNGIEYLEIDSADQRTLRIVCVNTKGMELSKANCRIEGGVRVTGISVETISITDNVITVTVNAAGDFSWYTFALVNPTAPEDTATDFDPVLDSIRFSFKAECPSEFDCAENLRCPPEFPAEPLPDYLAKDYDSFRGLMLDRMGQLIPDFHEDNPADFSVALVELLAYVGDQLSYYQDAVATEAYLGTARRRTSLRRHARLLDYAMHDGCNSRVYAAISIDAAADGQMLPARTSLLTRTGDGKAVAKSATLERLPDGHTLVFETMHALRLQSSHNRIAIHDWGDPHFCLGRGATAAALVDDPALNLEAGMVLILEEVLSPTTGLKEDTDTSHRHAVRLDTVEAGTDPLTNTPLQLVTWHLEDALPFPLCVSAEFNVGGSIEIRPIAVARGNVVLADHGQTRAYESMLPPQVPAVGAADYRPQLRETGIAFAVPYSHAVALARGWSAREALAQDPHRALPANMALHPDDPAQFGEQPLTGSLPWTPQRDLLGSDRFAREFVLETEHDASARLRFGDNQLGMAPEPGTRLLASYRLGGGRTGNVGAEAVTRVVTENAAIKPHITGVRNPMPAIGGTDPETADSIKLFAPEAFRTQERAVTEADYAEMAERHPDVQRAAARLHWTGSWYTMYISVDRRGGKPLDATFRKNILAFLERYRLAGYDLDLNDPIYVPLDIELQVCVLPGFFAADVKQELLRKFSSGSDDFGVPAFFNPDNFSFGDPLALSRLVRTALSVTGVASVSVAKFQRWGKAANEEIENGLITAEPLEVLRLDNDPNFPENGKLALDMLGGM